jgi:hypothetical protein
MYNKEVSELLNGQVFYHKTLTNKDGSPLKAKRNGKNKLWKTRPSEFKIPVKRGLYEFGYIDQDNYLDWRI